jgi:uncharacterized protein (TIGR04255 family)
MPFPTADRVLYEVNPLDEVVCQARFTPILRIDAELPANFQEDIRSDYPKYQQANPLNLPANLPPEVAQMMAAQLPFVQMVHEFTSRDDVWKVSLTRDFLALTCKRYDRWESFRSRFSVVLDATGRHYHPAFFTRIGLRFRDVFCRSKLGLEETPWSELLKPAITGTPGVPELAGDIEGFQTVTVLRLPQEIGKCGFRCTLALNEPDREQVFVLDSDFFTEEQTETGHAIAKLDAINVQADNFFRWCITDRLHRAMRPQPVPAD